MAKTLYDKLWDAHVVRDNGDGTHLIYIDKHLCHEVTTPQAFEGLRLAGRKIWRRAANLAVPDHNVPTIHRERINDPVSRVQLETLEANVRAWDVPYINLFDERQGIVHVIGPEQGASLPGMTIVCGDSHTTTNGALGAWAFGIGTSEVEHVLATQTLPLKKSRNMRVFVDGRLGPGVTAKDIALHVIGTIGTAGGNGHVIEFAGSAITQLSLEGRMTICNMAIEAGARAGLIAVDDTTINYVRGRPFAPTGALWEQAVAAWRTLHSDAGAHFDRETHIAAEEIEPSITWGTSPEMVVRVDGKVPDPEKETDSVKREGMRNALRYMDLKPGTPMTAINVDKVFIGSCTNARIEDLRAAAQVIKGRKRAASVMQALVVPGSGLVKRQAEKEGLDRIFLDAGFEWREPGCSMCLGMNEDHLNPGERCASTSNRNFEGRQGTGGRTHLVSPPMAAAAAIAGHFVDVRNFLNMHAFTTLDAIVAPLDRANVDTDSIIPKQFLKSIHRSGFGRYLFDTWRYADGGGEAEQDTSGRPLRMDFVLNQPRYKGAGILLTRENFGCGSSREHAVWALEDYGFRCVIAPSFADIFYANCGKNGVLAVPLDAAIVDRLFREVGSREGYRLRVDLKARTLTTPDGEAIAFEIDDGLRKRLLKGLDDIGVTLEHADAIRAYELKRAASAPWLFPDRDELARRP